MNAEWIICGAALVLIGGVLGGAAAQLFRAVRRDTEEPVRVALSLGVGAIVIGVCASVTVVALSLPEATSGAPGAGAGLDHGVVRAAGLPGVVGVIGGSIVSVAAFVVRGFVRAGVAPRGDSG